MNQYGEMNSYVDCEKLVDEGKIPELLKTIEEDWERLGRFHEFSAEKPLLYTFWKRYPGVARRCLLSLLSGEEGKQLVELLSAQTYSWEEDWEGARFHVKGNALYLMVWSGEYELVEALLERGMDPDGVGIGQYVMKTGSFITPESRWGRILWKEARNNFFLFSGWEESWESVSKRGEVDVITPLYLADLLGDVRMRELLKRYGATEVPPREKRWETMEPPKDVGSVFDRL